MMTPSVKYALIYGLTSIINLAHGDFNLVILHTNDVHARIEQTNKYSSSCSPENAAEDKCYGGVARRYSVISEVRRNHSNVLLLDAGDEFQGTVWFNYYNGSEASHFMNRLGYDAMALGNHEFDNSISGLLNPFLENVTFPVLACNLRVNGLPLLQTLVRPYTVLNVSGVQIGVIGYVTKKTAYVTNPKVLKNVEFTDEVECVTSSVQELKDQGIKYIIALGHTGYIFSQDVALIPGVDVVVDGHTNSFLYNGDPPDIEKPVGPYPLVVNQKDGGRALVYTAYAYGKYLGMANIVFNDHGEVKNWTGNPILLDKSWPQDPEILQEVERWNIPVQAFKESIMGETYVALEGGKDPCRLRECNMGNLLADAVMFKLLRKPTGDNWTDVAIGLWNAGSIRVPLPQDHVGSIPYNSTTAEFTDLMMGDTCVAGSAYPSGKPDFTTLAREISLADLMQVMPFRNYLEKVKVTGETLKGVLEHAVTELDPKAPPGRYLQVSGLKVTYDLDKPEGSRVAEVMVRCAECDVPQYTPLDDVKMYIIVTSDYLINGGDGFTVLRDNIIEKANVGELDVAAVTEYIRTHSPIIYGLEGRISYVRPEENNKDQMCINGASSNRVWLTLINILIIFISLAQL